ncbi:hypothetical protein PICMEDRAFT_80042 [Pichia membranifaciens NRRL Y-2026]|uniref:Signal recognition particle receptor subunit beta n=1 Tax=Pichia membranifaciens NRRL Y-2026 TaxID=763406 RepID=A0A1E3NRY4_9ASCO|nr:hypothetical protein PICMEDRAFT_80042 [Pichia membranifaciens NRRL Y-2026]ODQ48323.1 hypothetical protein PICMEDRAFT_80042 [Pichia membranifaciens NRRL Y-2026]
MEALKEEIKAEAYAIESNVETLVETTPTSSLILPILVTLLLILIGGFLMKRHSLISSNKRSFVICGLQGSGKTNLFHLLTKGKLPVLTVSTLEPGKGELKLSEEYSNQKTFQDIEILDFPANPKLKTLYLTPHLHANLNSVQGIIYIIDSSNFDTKSCHQAAEDLLELMNITEGKPNGVDILVFANKNDLFTSKKSSKIKEMLEAEVSKIYQLKLRGLSKVDLAGKDGGEEDNDNLDLATKDGKFEFQQLEGNVDFAQGNIFKDKWSMIVDWMYEKIVN